MSETYAGLVGSSAKSFTRSDILAAIVKVSVFSLSTYVTIKWMVKQLDPTNKQKKIAATKAREILDKLNIKDVKELSEYELTIASQLLDPNDIKVTWSSIGGLGKVIKEIKETVILPIKRKDLFVGSMLTQPPKGVLLHGPPGCGKTMIAKATAKEAGCRFINLDLSILTDKWYGESQKLASAVFSLAVKLQPCIVFLDEIDSFLRSRTMEDHEATAMMKAQFMTLWDGLSTDSTCTVIVMGATNRPNDLDKAILRRMPATFHIPLPDVQQRKEILQLVLEQEPIDRKTVDFDLLAKSSEGFSGSDLRELCRHATMYRIQDFMTSHSDGSTSQKNLVEEKEEKLRLISMADLTTSLKKMKEAHVNK